MKPHLRWVQPVVGLFVILIATLCGMLVIAVVGGTPVGVKAPVADFVVFAAGFVPIAASFLAVRKPQIASRILFCVAPFTPLFVVLFPWEFVSLFGSSLIFFGAIVIPATFWFLAYRRSWPLLLKRPLLPLRPSLAVVVCSVAFCMFVLIAVILSFSLPWWYPVGDCGGRSLLDEHGVPRNLDFTARIVFVGPRSLNRWSLWSIALIEERFSRLPAWMPKYVVLRAFFEPTDKNQRFFVEGVRSDGAITRFLPIIEKVDCGSTRRLDKASVELHVLRSASHDSSRCSAPGGTLLGPLYTDRDSFLVGEKLNLVDSKGRRFTAVTDRDGIFEFRHLPVGEYVFDSKLTSGRYVDESSVQIEEGTCVEHWLQVQPDVQ